MLLRVVFSLWHQIRRSGLVSADSQCLSKAAEVVVVVRVVAFTWTGVHAQTILQPLVVQPRLTVGEPLHQTHGFVFVLCQGTIGASARASLGLLGNVDRSQRIRHRQCFGMLPACDSGHCGAGLGGPNPF